MNVASSSKRQTTPSSLHRVKRAKTEDTDTKPLSDSTHPVSLAVPNGVERIPFPPNVNVNRLASEHLQELIHERIRSLHQQGRRLVGLPVMLNDGIVIHWVRGSAESADISPGQILPSSEGLVWSRKADNNRTTNLPRRFLRYSDRNGEERHPATPVGIGGGSGTSTGDAITIDSDEERSHQGHGPQPLQTESPSNFDHSLHEIVDHSDSDIEFISWIRPANKVEDYYSATASCSSREITPDLPSDRDFMAVSPGPRRPQLTREEVAGALFPEQEYTRTTSSNSEDDASARLSRDEVAVSPFREQTGISASDTQRTRSGSEGRSTETNDLDDVGPLSQRRALPLAPSLEPIRQLLARSKRKEPTSHGNVVIAKTTSQQQQRREVSPQETDSGESSENNEERERVDDWPSKVRFKRVPLPKTEHGRARRLLKPESPDLPLVAITMRGDCHFLHGKKKFRITGYSLPNPGVVRHVEDCCMVGDTAVLGCDKGSHQISLLSFSQGRPQMIDVVWSPHNSAPRYQDTQKKGIKCLAAMHAEGGHIKFFSGGHDGTIHKWKGRAGRTDEPRSEQVASLGACVTAVAYRDRDTSVLSSTQSKLHITDLNRSKTINHLLSNDVHHIHIHPQAAYVTMLEVKHLDRQVQLFDSRKGHFDGEPCLSFGRRNLDSKFSPSYTRGSVRHFHFARGSEDGRVLLWDFRNSKEAVVEKSYRRAEKVVHTIFADKDIATFGDGVVTFFEDYLVQ